MHSRHLLAALPLALFACAGEPTPPAASVPTSEAFDVDSAAVLDGDLADPAGTAAAPLEVTEAPPSAPPAPAPVVPATPPAAPAPAAATPEAAPEAAAPEAATVDHSQMDHAHDDGQ